MHLQANRNEFYFLHSPQGLQPITAADSNYAVNFVMACK